MLGWFRARTVPIWLLSTALMGLVLVHSARADDKPEAPYYALVREALEEFDHGNWEEAYGLFVQAHALRPNARTLRGMGFAALESRHYVRAQRHLRDAMSEMRSPLTSQQRVDVEKALATANRFIARLGVSGIDSSRLQIDGSSSLERDSDDSLLIDPGKHELSVDTPTGRIVRTLDLFPGERRELALTAPSTVAPTPTETATRAEMAAAPAAAPRAEVERDGRGLRIGGYVILGTTALAAGGAIAMHVLAHAGESDVRDVCAPHACTRDVVNREIDGAHIETYQTLAVVGWSLAGVSAVTAGVLLILGHRKKGQPDIALSASARGLLLTGQL